MPATKQTRALKHSLASKTVKRGQGRKLDVIGLIALLILLTGVATATYTLWNLYGTDYQANRQAATDVKAFQAPCSDITSLDERTSPPPEIGAVTQGEVFATMHVPAWRFMTIPIKEGTSPKVLNTGAGGHYLGSAMPGQIGNFSVAAHRRSYGSNFRRVDILKKGDPIIIETKTAWLIYKVDQTRIVNPTDTTVIKPNPINPENQPTGRYLTMTTCHPEYGNSERFIVRNLFDHWIPKESGIPKELATQNPCTK